MKKQYVKPESYLLNFNTPEGAEAGSGGAGGEAGGTGDSGTPNPQPNQGEQPGQPQSQDVDWRSSIPKEHRENARFQNVNSLEELLSSFATLKEAPTPPTELKAPEGVPEEFAAWGVEKGLTQEQFDGLVEKYTSIETGRLENIKTANQQGFNELVKSWGEESKANLQLANRVVEFADPKGELGLVDFLKGPESNFASINPMIVTLFYNIGKAMKEGGALVSNTPPKNAPKKKMHYSHELYPNQAPNKN